MKDVPMKEMSLQQVIEFWTYLHNQAELKLQAFIDVPYGSSYKDEKRAEAETYQQLVKKFSENFVVSISGTEDIRHGLAGEQVAGFLDYINERTLELKSSREKTQHNWQEALANAHGEEYQRAKSIYKDMENLQECQTRVFENSRKILMSIFEES